jgi:putative radical SAM enzyme (TIGR03279 family)
VIFVSVVVVSVLNNSYGEKAGILKNDEIISINGREITDVLDYRFAIQSKKLSIIFKRGLEELQVNIRKSSEFSDIGLEFETYLMDKHHSCKNKCIFCFVDQMPKGMRDTLYFKDDDSRLSFLFGNYITLTNLTEKEADRICEMHISPINISVHTMNPELRVKMMKNKNAGDSLKLIKKFYEAGILMNTQLVLCPGINDGEELRYSLNELAKFSPCINSIAAVPVGITKFRDNLEKLDIYTKETAGEVIDIIDEFNAHYSFFNEGKILAFASDEFYLLAEREFPTEDYYGEYSQLDNGVGMCTLLKSEFMSALDESKPEAINREITIATGESAYSLLCDLVSHLKEKFIGLKVNVIKVENEFFGKTVTVAGLLTGQDLKEQLQNKALGEELLIPRVSLRNEGDKFLDDVTLTELSQFLNIKVTPVENDGYKLLESILGGA